MAGLDAENFAWHSDPERVSGVTLVETGAIAIGPFGRAGGSGLRFSGNADDEYVRTPAQDPQGAILELEPHASVRD